MTKFYCDQCGKEVGRDEIGSRLDGRKGHLDFEIITGLDGSWNGGHFCHACIRAAVANPDTEATP